ncbi:MAG: phosphocholine cytidylyltransferase family protein [Myxococcales bacterium]|nr:phosphocholine cytidylyltransferase family protein [Myxococcales bacterium]MDH5305717.1 phosphocholine cytidylyltransferase family protein [Myxococcales bacterium]MDH5565104.1 phosphocholine cytidylyltransferase family protein [Myxococcales bacterium]
MKAIILSAGQGRRLLPMTAERPKCLLPVDGDQSMLSMQLGALARCGIERASVVVGFGAAAVEAQLAERPVPGLAVETLFNPFFASSDNLVSCWLARSLMHDDFLLLNGDTLFEDAVLERLLEAPPAPIAVTIDRKTAYDDDDMKVGLDANGRLLAIGKDLPAPTVGAESIGLIAFRESGAKIFADELGRVIRAPAALRRWYLSVVNELAQHNAVETVCIQGLWWCEIDSPDDLARARADCEARSRA